MAIFKNISYTPIQCLVLAPCSPTDGLAFLNEGSKNTIFVLPYLHHVCTSMNWQGFIYLFLLGDTRYRHTSLQALFIELTSLSPRRQNKGKPYIGNAGFKPGPLDLKARSLFVSPWTLGHPKQTFLKIEFQLPVLRQRRL